MVWSTALFFYSNKPIRETFIHTNWSVDDEAIGKDNIKLNGKKIKFSMFYKKQNVCKLFYILFR